MKKTPDFDAAAEFMATRARVLDRRVFQRLFQGGAPEPVRDAVAAYRNDDGGFGHALEPDLRAAASQPAAVEMALRIMDAADAWDEHLVRDAIDWLVTIAPAEGGAPFGLPTLSGPARPVVGARRGQSRLADPDRPDRGRPLRPRVHPPVARRRDRGHVARHRPAHRAERLRDVRRAGFPAARPRPLPRQGHNAANRAIASQPGRTRPERRGRDTLPLGLRPPAQLDCAQPLRRRHNRGPPEPPGRRSTRGRRLDVQLARLITRPPKPTGGASSHSMPSACSVPTAARSHKN